VFVAHEITPGPLLPYVFVSIIFIRVNHTPFNIAFISCRVRACTRARAHVCTRVRVCLYTRGGAYGNYVRSIKIASAHYLLHLSSLSVNAA